MLTGVGNRDHIISVLVHLYWLPVCFQAKFKVLMLIFTALCGSWLTYLKENLPSYCCHSLRPYFRYLLLLRLGGWQPRGWPSQLWHQNAGALFPGTLICPFLLLSSTSGWGLFWCSISGPLFLTNVQIVSILLYVYVSSGFVLIIFVDLIVFKIFNFLKNAFFHCGADHYIYVRKTLWISINQC